MLQNTLASLLNLTRTGCEADTELKKARKQAVTGENETEEALDKLDQILKEVRDNAVKQETE